MGRYLLTVRRIYFAQLRLYEIFGRGVRSVADPFQVYHIARRSSLQLPGGPLLYVQGNFFGKIEGINGMVNFEGQSVQELTDAFHEAVDDYIAFCEEEGIQPHKSYSGLLNVRLTPEMHSRVAMLAKRTGISINAFIKQALEKQIMTML